MTAPTPGSLWKHFKGNIYRVVTIAKHSETLEPMVVYKEEKAQDDAHVWVRPLAMWQETLEYEKKTTKRFTLIDTL